MAKKLEIRAAKTILVDDHLMFCEAIGELMKRISPEGNFRYFNNVEKAMGELQKNDSHFLLCDLLIPGDDVKKFIRNARTRYPELSIVVMSSVSDINVIKECFTLGANGYLSKAISYSELKKAMESICRNGGYVSADLASRLFTAYFRASKDNLTIRELEVLRLIAAGHTVMKTAQLLQVSPSTIMTHRRSIMTKLDLHSAAEIVKYAFENNLV